MYGRDPAAGQLEADPADLGIVGTQQSGLLESVEINGHFNSIVNWQEAGMPDWQRWACLPVAVCLATVLRAPWRKGDKSTEAGSGQVSMSMAGPGSRRG